MAYVPQFIPTNTQALQGTLNQYQEASDRNTGILNQANDLYSALPTTNPYDTTKKNEIMGKFQKDVITGLDKKYNYDRSNQQYAKDLASEIGKLRSDPLWTLVKERDQVDKVRQQLIAQRGADYHENINPDKVTDVNQLKDWKPMDLKDLDKGMMMAAMAKTQTMQPNTSWTDTGKGYWEVKQVQGFESRDEAANYLTNNKEGQDLVRSTATALGFDPSDPKIYSRAFTAAMDKLVGEAKYTTETNYDYLDRLKRSGEEQQQAPQGLPRIGTQSPTQTFFEVNKLSDVSNLDNNIKKLQDEIAVNPDENKQAELDRLTVQKGKIKSIVDNIEALPENKKITEALHTEINKELGRYSTFIAGDKSAELYDIIRDSFIDTSSIGRSTLNPLSKKNKTDIILEVAGVLNTYKDPSRKISPNVISSIAKDIVNIGEDWYKGKNNFAKGYSSTVEKQINEKLQGGEQVIYGDYRLPSDMKPTDRESLKDFLVSTLHVGVPLEPDYKQGGSKGIMWKKDMPDKLKSRLNKPNTDVGFLFDNQENAFIQMHNPGDEKTKTEPTTVTYKIDPAISGYDMLDELVKRTGDPRFLNSIYSQFDIAPGKEYSFKDKNGYLSRTLGKYFKDNNGKPDIDMFRDFRIKENANPDGSIEYNVFVGEDDTEPTVYPNKPTLLRALAMARQDYKTNYR